MHKLLNNLLCHLLWGRCKNCNAALTIGSFLEISLYKFEKINSHAADLIKYDYFSRQALNRNPGIRICENCASLLSSIIAEEHKQKYLEQQRLYEQEQFEKYRELLRKEVDLRLLEKKAVEVGINLQEFKENLIKPNQMEK